jgi:hypothetical protein
MTALDPQGRPMDLQQQSKPKDILRKSLRYLVPVLIFVAAAVGAYTWFSLIRPCEATVVERASVLLIDQRDRYDHTYQFATSASPDAVIRPVAELQQILMDTQDVAVPACMQTAKTELVHYMGTVIHAFVAYGAREPETAVRKLIIESEMYYDNFNTELEAVKECAPFCIP